MKTTTSNKPPSDPQIRDGWFNPDDGSLKIYDGLGWREGSTLERIQELREVFDQREILLISALMDVRANVNAALYNISSSIERLDMDKYNETWGNDEMMDFHMRQAKKSMHKVRDYIDVLIMRNGNGNGVE